MELKIYITSIFSHWWAWLWIVIIGGTELDEFITKILPFWQTLKNKIPPKIRHQSYILRIVVCLGLLVVPFFVFRDEYKRHQSTKAKLARSQNKLKTLKTKNDVAEKNLAYNSFVLKQQQKIEHLENQLQITSQKADNAQSTATKLVEEQEPRIITLDLASKIINHLKSFTNLSKSKITVYHNLSDPEAWKYSLMWAQIFQRAGWTVEEVQMQSTEHGTYIRYNDKNVNESRIIAEEISNLFSERVSLMRDPNIQENNIELNISTKEISPH